MHAEFAHLPPPSPKKRKLHSGPGWYHLEQSSSLRRIGPNRGVTLTENIHGVGSFLYGRSHNILRPYLRWHNIKQHQTTRSSFPFFQKRNTSSCDAEIFQDVPSMACTPQAKDTEQGGRQLPGTCGTHHWAPLGPGSGTEDSTALERSKPRKIMLVRSDPV